MCWSRHKREAWKQEQREAELEAERIRLVSAKKEEAEEPKPVVEREQELVRS
jgi:hypothetical protein